MHPDPHIGVFDSGVGGLSVVRALCNQLPGVGLHYFADSAHAPYGGQSEHFVWQRSLCATERLLAAGAGLIVVACNTATAAAIDRLRARFPSTPFVGIEPGLKPALLASPQRRIGVLATARTLQSKRFHALLAAYGVGAQVTTVACTGVVEAIERGELDTPALRACIASHAQSLREAGVEVALLGCTHYPLVLPLWRAALGSIVLHEVEPAVAQQVARLWAPSHAAPPATAEDPRAVSPPSTAPKRPRLMLESTGDARVLVQLAQRVLPPFTLTQF